MSKIQISPPYYKYVSIELLLFLKKIKKRKQKCEAPVLAQNKEYKAMFGLLFFITQFSSLVTHHSKYLTRLAQSLTFHHSVFFILFVGPIPVTLCRIFFFFFHLVSLNPVKKKKKNRTANQEKKGEKKRVKSGQKVGLVLFVSPLCVFNYNIVIEL